MKVLILGGHGFIGKNVMNLLRNKDYHCYIYSRRDGFDLTDQKMVEKIFSDVKPDIILNLASHGGGMHYLGKHPAEIVNDNTRMFLNIYEVARKIVPSVMIINALSNCSYPGDLDILEEKLWLNGNVHDSVFAYGHSKRYLYVVSNAYKMQYNINSINYIFPNAYGPYDYNDPQKTKALNGMIIRMLKSIKDGDNVFEIWGTGMPIREWIYSEDFANILIESFKIRESIIYPVNVAQNKGISIKETAEMIAEALNFKGKLVFNEEYKDGALIKIMDNKKFQKVMPEYKFKNYQKGIFETVKYYQSLEKGEI